jgi:hypothetical protein
MSKFLAVSALMVLAVPALARSPDQTAGRQVQAKPNPADKVICKTEETTGTRLGGHRVCATEHEWRELAEQTQAAVQKIQQQDSGICHEGRCN